MHERKGCFRQVNQKGKPETCPSPESQEALTKEAAAKRRAPEEASATACQEVEEAKGWTGEISLDIEVAHATCQNCHIVLVEAKSTEYKDLEAADNRAVQMGATEVSNSWGGEEPTQDSSAFNHPGIVVTASAGDSGYLNWDAENSFEKGSFPVSGLIPTWSRSAAPA